jgi:hypothetical protein
MGVQARQDNTTEPLLLDGVSYVRDASIAQDENRTTPLLKNTVMAQIAATRLWVPFNDLTTEGGTSVPRGIYVGSDIEADDLVDGDIEDVPIMVGGACTVNENLVVWDDDTLDADSIVNAGDIESRTARMALQESSGIYLEDTVSISEYEN